MRSGVTLEVNTSTLNLQSNNNIRNKKEFLTFAKNSWLLWDFMLPPIRAVKILNIRFHLLSWLQFKYLWPVDLMRIEILLSRDFRCNAIPLLLCQKIWRVWHEWDLWCVTVYIIRASLGSVNGSRTVWEVADSWELRKKEIWETFTAVLSDSLFTHRKHHKACGEICQVLWD